LRYLSNMGMSSCSAEAHPHPSLSGLVQKYTGSALSGFTPGLHIGAPSPTLPLILTLRDHPVTLTTTHHGTETMNRFSGFVAGLQLSPVLIAHEASSHTLTIHLTPAGVRCLLDVPAVELVGQAVSATAVLGPSAQELRSRLELLDDWPTMFGLVDTFLRRRLPDRRRHGGLAVVAWETITMTRGRRTVASVAEHLRCSPRTLHASLKAEVGIGPKALARMVRFASARSIVHQRLLSQHTEPTLAQIAADCGYADEAHLIRDWSTFNRTSPARWRTHDEFAFLTQ
jgi:AraC-like DNA-binding protein